MPLAAIHARDRIAADRDWAGRVSSEANTEKRQRPERLHQLVERVGVLAWQQGQAEGQTSRRGQAGGQGGLAAKAYRAKGDQSGAGRGNRYSPDRHHEAGRGAEHEVADEQPRCAFPRVRPWKELLKPRQAGESVQKTQQVDIEENSGGNADSERRYRGGRLASLHATGHGCGGDHCAAADDEERDVFEVCRKDRCCCPTP